MNWGYYRRVPCNRNICTCTQTEEYYVWTDVQTFYLCNHITRTPSLKNPLIQMTPPWTRWQAPLHGILPKTAHYPPTSTSTSTYTSKVPRAINISASSKHSATGSRAQPFPHQLSAATRPVIGIGKYTRLNDSDLILLNGSDLILLFVAYVYIYV